MGVYTDNWVGTQDTALHTYNANWVVNQGDFRIEGAGQPTPGTGVYAFSVTGSNVVFAHYELTMSNDQFAQATVQLAGVGTEYTGVAVRCAASTGKTGYYLIYAGDGHNSFFGYVDSGGTSHDIGSDRGSWAANDIMYLSLVGTTWTLKKNGSTLATGSDSNVASGFAGISGANASGGTIAPQWSGGDANPAVSTINMNKLALLGVGQ